MKTRISILFLLIVLSAVPLFSQNDGEPRGLYQRGREFQNNQDYFRAIEYYRLSIEQNPRYIYPLIGLAESYFHLAEYEEALNFVTQARNLSESRTDLKNLEARIHIGLGNIEDAETLFNEVLSAEPNNLEAQFGYAELDIAAGRIQSAAERYRRALRIAPRNRRALLSLSFLYEAMGSPDQADEYVNLALRYHSENPQVHYLASYHYYLKGDYSQATSYINTAISMDPEYEDALLLKASILLQLGEYNDIISLMQDLLSINRRNPLAFYTLGIAYSKLDQHEDSIRSFRNALSLSPGDEIHRIALESELIRSTDIEDDSRNQWAQYHFNQARIYKERNYYSKALIEFRRGLMLQPLNLEGRMGYAEILLLQGHRARYLDELLFLQNNGVENQEISDAIEISQSLLRDSVASDWGVEQFLLEREQFTLNIYFADTDHTLDHTFAEEILSDYFQESLQRFPNMDLPESVQRVESFSEAFRNARENESDYFIMLNFDETERVFSISVRLFLSRTGSELASNREIRSGNFRVRDAITGAAEELHALFPLHGSLIDRHLNRGLINLGEFSGITAEDRLTIVRKDTLQLRTDSVGFQVSDENILGNITITETDDHVAEGLLEEQGFYDLINRGDEIIYISEEDDEDSQHQIEDPFFLPEIYSRILSIR
ncbi:MAG: tetratricopeptide repeat protein [Spirochaetia bacterium]